MAATVTKMAVPSVIRLLLRQNATSIVLASAKGIMNMPKLADTNGYDHKNDEVQSTDQFPKEESHKIYMQTTDDSLKINLEHISHNLQKDLIEQLGPFLKAAEDELIPSVSFNYLAEDVYRYNLFMTFSRMGYESTFTRYNHDKGLATFNLIDSEKPVMKYSYFKSGQPNLC